MIIAIAVNTGVLDFLYDPGSEHNVTALANKLQVILSSIHNFSCLNTFETKFFLFTIGVFNICY